MVPYTVFKINQTLKYRKIAEHISLAIMYNFRNHQSKFASCHPKTSKEP